MENYLNKTPDETQIAVKKDFPSLPDAEIVRFSNEFTTEFLLDKKKQMIDVPIDALRIVFKIASDLRNSQFQKGQPVQLELFDKDFLNEHNTFAQFRINLNEISLNKNTARVKKAIEFLENFKKGWYKTTNKEGKEVNSYGGLITNPSYMKSSMSFLISSYWLSKLSFLPQYNNALYEMAFNISNNKHIVFYFWLVTFPDNGSRLNYETINEKFNLNYPSSKELCKNFLKKVKISLDKHATTSFNYSYKGDTINIAPYVVKNTSLKEKASIDLIVTSQKTHYWRLRHKLSDGEKTRITECLKKDPSSLNLFMDAYKNFVKSVRKEKKKATDYIGNDFMKLFQDHIEICYLKTKTGKIYKNGYPKII